MNKSTTYIRKPSWLKIKVQSGAGVKKVEDILSRYRLHSVCEEAKCPNRAECYSNKTATFIILGKQCTRGCLFCNLSRERPLPPDPQEPKHVAEAVVELGLEYVVITSVTRDDLSDGGSNHFIEVVTEIRNRDENISIELLIPDFAGNTKAIDRVLSVKPTVLNHNIETVERLYKSVRVGAEYQRSLDLLKRIKSVSGVYSKSGIILGMGEREDEVFKLLEDLRSVDCDLLTIGQYLAPTSNHLKVAEYVTPEQFKKWEEIAYQMGFKGVKSGPLVRSSYNAKEMICTI